MQNAHNVQMVLTLDVLLVQQTFILILYLEQLEFTRVTLHVLDLNGKTLRLTHVITVILNVQHVSEL